MLVLFSVYDEIKMSNDIMIPCSLITLSMRGGGYSFHPKGGMWVVLGIGCCGITRGKCIETTSTRCVHGISRESDATKGEENYKGNSLGSSGVRKDC